MDSVSNHRWIPWWQRTPPSTLHARHKQDQNDRRGSRRHSYSFEGEVWLLYKMTQNDERQGCWFIGHRDNMNTTRWTRKFVSELRILFEFSSDPIEEISLEMGRSFMQVQNHKETIFWKGRASKAWSGRSKKGSNWIDTKSTYRRIHSCRILRRRENTLDQDRQARQDTSTKKGT